MPCPKQETLLEWVSISAQMRPTTRVFLWWHTRVCRGCTHRIQALKRSWSQLLRPEPDVIDSIIRVYSRLKRDETLILKGWKLGDLRTRSVIPWIFRGSIAFSALVLAFWVAIYSFSEDSTPQVKLDGPMAQIRYEDKNRVQVRYVRPELLQSIEFETASRP